MHPQAVRMLLPTEEVRRYQVVQRARDRFDVALVAPPGCDRDETCRRVEQKFGEQFGPTSSTRVEFVEELPRTPAGKVRSVISLTGAPPAEFARRS
jgi:phenylacetate-coenzyme A ligase PaaK-like adenylate-forming protein